MITKNIKIALKDGWVITFPQGTTKSLNQYARVLLYYGAPPNCCSIVIDGFRRSFDKKGLRMKRRESYNPL
jgi:hypothetical protein